MLQRCISSGIILNSSQIQKTMHNKTGFFSVQYDHKTVDTYLSLLYHEAQSDQGLHNGE